MSTHEIELFAFLDTLEENFLNGKIPYDKYKATIEVYAKQRLEEFLGETRSE